MEALQIFFDEKKNQTTTFTFFTNRTKSILQSLMLDNQGKLTKLKECCLENGLEIDKERIYYAYNSNINFKAEGLYYQSSFL